MNITDEQAELLARCGVCQGELDRDQVREGIEAGATPMQFLCRECAASEERRHRLIFGIGLKVAGDLVFERIKAAGLVDRFHEKANEIVMRSRNEHN